MFIKSELNHAFKYSLSPNSDSICRICSLRIIHVGVLRLESFRKYIVQLVKKHSKYSSIYNNTSEKEKMKYFVVVVLITRFYDKFLMKFT